MNPYTNLPSSAFWRRSISEVDPDLVDPVIAAPFTISPSTAVATVGSCFAQHISRTLVQEGFHYLVTEPEPVSPDNTQRGSATFSARFGNVYTIRQLLQLFDRAYGLFAPVDSVWRREDGAFVDPFRPRIEAAGYPTAAAALAERKKHLAFVRRMFEKCEVLIFTLGLTEGWASEIDNAVVPLAPGVAGTGPDPDSYKFTNFPVDHMNADLLAFIDKLRLVNSSARVILTVSPVPLVATYEPRHVLVSNTYSKSALRVVAEVVSQSRTDVAYFPSFEIITGLHQRSRFYGDDLREVTPAGVANVMTLFKRHYLRASPSASKKPHRVGLGRTAGSFKARPAQAVNLAQRAGDAMARIQELSDVICDEELLDSNEPSN
jgi:GSCFA family